MKSKQNKAAMEKNTNEKQSNWDISISVWLCVLALVYYDFIHKSNVAWKQIMSSNLLLLFNAQLLYTIHFIQVLLQLRIHNVVNENSIEWMDEMELGKVHDVLQQKSF